MKKLYFLFLLTLITFSGFAQNVTITKIIETGCASPFVKSVELYVDGSVDFSTEVVINFMTNGGDWDSTKIDVSGLGTVTDAFVYIVRDIDLMQAEFPGTTFTENVNTVITGTATNGDDGYQVELNGVVVSQFGKTGTDADNDTETDWNHGDAVATRKDGVPDTGVWNRSHWDITAENDLDDFTSCQNSDATPATNLEIYFATLGSTYSLGSGSGWTPTAATCTTALTDANVSCNAVGVGMTDDTYTALVDFAGGNNGKVFVITATAGTIGGDNPNSTATGTIEVTGITEGTDIIVTLKDIADGGVCDLSISVESPACIPLIINEVLFDPAGDDSDTAIVEGDANGDGVRDFAQDEFIEFYNISDSPLDISGYKVFDGFALDNNIPRHIFPASTIIPAKSALVLFGGGSPAGDFGSAIVQTASEDLDPADDNVNPELNLSNSGDIITIKNTMDVTALVYDSSSTGINHGNNQSVTRNPDLTGSFALHSDANASLAFSPGTKIDGSTLSTADIGIENLGVYPNPAKANSGFINITSSLNESFKVVIFDVLGKKIVSQTISNNQMDISNLKTGIYLVKITQDNKQTTKRIVIQ
jgi:hypothetical protein